MTYEQAGASLLKVGQKVTVLGPQPGYNPLWAEAKDEKPFEGGGPQQPDPSMGQRLVAWMQTVERVSGVPFEVAAVDMPFVALRDLVNDKTIALDTRKMSLTTLSDEYVEALVQQFKDDEVTIDLRPEPSEPNVGLKRLGGK